MLIYFHKILEVSLLSIKDNNYEQHQSLDEINNTIHFDHKGSASQKFLAFLGLDY